LSDVDSARTWDVRLGYLPDSWATTGGGTGGRVITVLDDVTEKLELQESVRRGEMMSALGALVAGVAHEVRNPLFGMSAVLDAIDVTFGADSAYQPFTDALRTELTRLNGLMGDLLDYGRPPNTERVRHSLTQTVMQGVVACAPLAERRRITINTKLSRAVEPVLMDAPRLAQVFQNLLENAIQHSSEKGHITVAVNSFTMGQEVWAECTVRDQGPGIAEDDLSNIFKPFYTRRRGGTGLGLSIVQRIVTEHRGTVTAANHPQGGAVMTVRLPCTN
jgi:signal transduction histidine kinase